MKKGDMPRSLFGHTAMALALSVLASCGGGGGGGSSSGISPASLALERDFSGAIGPINAAAAYDRGHAGGYGIVHMIDASIVADDSQLKTHVTRQYEVSETETGETTVALASRPPYTSPEGSYADTIKAQLVAEPRNGEYGHGVAYNAEIYAYRLNTGTPSGDPDADASERQRLRATALLEASERIDSDIIHLNFSTSDDISDELLQAIAVTAAQNDLMTIAVGEEGEQASNPLIFSDPVVATSSLIYVGSVDQSNQLNSAQAGAAKDSFIVAPGEDLRVQMWNEYFKNEPYVCGIVIVLPLYCDNYVKAYEWSAESRSGPLYAQAVATGAGAILRDAYPYLNAAEIKSLMLTTARDLGAPGVDDVYGHGLIDLDRATQPVGELEVAQGHSVDGEAASLQSTRLSLGPAFGDALDNNALLAQGVAFDGFGRPFTVGLDQRVDRQEDGFGLGSFLAQRDLTRGSAAFGDRATLHLATAAAEPERRWTSRLAELRRHEAGERYSVALDLDAAALGRLRFGLGTSPQSVLGLSTGELALASDDLGFLSSSAARLPQLDLVGGGAGLGLTHALAPGSDLVLGLYGSSEGIDLGDDERHALQALARHRLTDRLTVGVGLGLLDERGTFLASESSGAFGEEAENQAAFGSLLGRYARGDWSLEGSWTIAAAQPDLAADGMLGDLGTVYADSWALGLIRRGLFAEGDRIGLMLGQPFRVTRAEGSLDVPVSRDLAGNVIRTSERVSLEPSGREIDLELAYARPLSEAASLDTHLFVRHEPGHDASAEPDLGLVARLNWHW
jgi:hypothetical protein